jgi:hypothetical protein
VSDARTPVRPAHVCRALLAALDASEGRRKRRVRDTTADAIGLGIKRAILEAVVDEDPAPDTFEAWLFEQCRAAPADVGAGAMRAMALDVFAEWKLAVASESFAAWLDAGAPSDDRAGDPPRRDISAV